MTDPSQQEHDAWLRTALRHAPDAEVAPPPRLRTHILHAASEATNGGLAAAANPARWFGALFDRPVWATGFASVFVAVVAVAVWSPWSDGPDPAVVTSGRSDATPGAPAASSPAPAAEVVARAEPPREAPTAETRSQRPAERSERAKARPEAAPAAPAATPPVAAAPAEAERRSAQLGARTTAADASNESANTAAAPARNDVPSPLLAPRRGLRTEPDMWTWQRGSQDPVAVNDTLRRWLDKLDEAAAGRWETIRADPPGARGLATLTLLREERIHTIVRIETDGVSRRGAVRMRASLDPAVASALARELGQIAP